MNAVRASLLVVGLALAAHAFGAEPAARPLPSARPVPRLTCTVEMPSAPAPDQPKPQGVGSLHRIRVNVALSGAGTEDLRLSGPDVADPTLSLSVRAAGEGERAAVATKATMISRGEKRGAKTASLLVEVPILEAERDRKIAAYLSEVEQAAKSRKQLSDEKIALFNQQRAAIASGLRELYVENQVGEFDLECVYASQAAGFWNGEVRSSPEKLRIVSEGEFFDQPQYRDQ